MAPDNNYGRGTLVVNSVIQNGSLTKGGYGVLRLDADNTFTGPLVINSGGWDGNNHYGVDLYGTLDTKDVRVIGSQLRLHNDDRLPSDGIVQVDSRGTLNLNTNSQTLRYVQDGPNGGGAVLTGSGGTLTLNPTAADSARRPRPSARP